MANTKTIEYDLAKFSGNETLKVAKNQELDIKFTNDIENQIDYARNGKDVVITAYETSGVKYTREEISSAMNVSYDKKSISEAATVDYTYKQVDVTKDSVLYTKENISDKTGVTYTKTEVAIGETVSYAKIETSLSKSTELAYTATIADSTTIYKGNFEDGEWTWTSGEVSFTTKELVDHAKGKDITYIQGVNTNPIDDNIEIVINESTDINTIIYKKESAYNSTITYERTPEKWVEKSAEYVLSDKSGAGDIITEVTRYEGSKSEVIAKDQIDKYDYSDANNKHVTTIVSTWTKGQDDKYGWVAGEAKDSLFEEGVEAGTTYDRIVGDFTLTQSEAFIDMTDADKQFVVITDSAWQQVSKLDETTGEPITEWKWVETSKKDILYNEKEPQKAGDTYNRVIGSYINQSQETEFNMTDADKQFVKVTEGKFNLETKKWDDTVTDEVFDKQKDMQVFYRTVGKETSTSTTTFDKSDAGESHVVIKDYVYQLVDKLDENNEVIKDNDGKIVQEYQWVLKSQNEELYNEEEPQQAGDTFNRIIGDITETQDKEFDMKDADKQFVVIKDFVYQLVDKLDDKGEVIKDEQGNNVQVWTWVPSKPTSAEYTDQVAGTTYYREIADFINESQSKEFDMSDADKIFVTDNILGTLTIANLAGSTGANVYLEYTGSKIDLINSAVEYFDTDDFNKKGAFKGSSLAEIIDASEWASSNGKGVNINAGAGNDSIQGSDYNDTIKATAGDNKIYEISGTNKITTGNGNDEIYIGQDNFGYPGSGSSFAYSYSSNTINAGNGNNFISLDSLGTNKVTTGKGLDTIVAFDGINNINSGAGDDKISLIGGMNTVKSTKGNNEVNITTGHSNNKITLGSGSDTINAVDGYNTINTGAGVDHINLNGGTNSVKAGKGDDIFTITGGDNILNGEAGNDTYNVENLSYNNWDSTIINDSKGSNEIIFSATDRSNLDVLFNVTINKKGALKSIGKEFEFTKIEDIHFVDNNDTLVSIHNGDLSSIEDVYDDSHGIDYNGAAKTLGKVTFGTSSVTDFSAKVNAIAQDVASWLSKSDYSSTEQVIDKGSAEEIASLLAVYDQNIFQA